MSSDQPPGQGPPPQQQNWTPPPPPPPPAPPASPAVPAYGYQPAQYFPGSGYPAQPGGYAYAGFWIRLLARLVDAVIIWIGSFVLFVVAAVAGNAGDGVRGVVFALWILIVIALSIGYWIYFWTAHNGQTPGNMVTKIRVIKVDGTPLTVGVAVLRYIGYIVDSLICGLPIGYIWAAFDARKQAWHDKIASTFVVKVA